MWNPVVDWPLVRGFMWTDPLKCLALAGVAAILAARMRDGATTPSWLVRTVSRLEPLGAVFLAVFRRVRHAALLVPPVRGPDDPVLDPGALVLDDAFEALALSGVAFLVAGTRRS